MNQDNNNLSFNENIQNNEQKVQPSEYTNLQQNNQYEPLTVEQSENVLLGAVGAFVGSLIGGLSIFLFLKLGYVASISGVLMGLAATYGYKLLAKRMGKIGLIITAIITIINVYLSYHLSISYMIAGEAGIPFSEVFLNLYSMMDSANVTADFVRDLVLLYVFCVIGMFSVFSKKEKEIKK